MLDTVTDPFLPKSLLQNRWLKESCSSQLLAGIKIIRIILQRYYNKIDNQRKKEMKNTPNDVAVKQKEKHIPGKLPQNQQTDISITNFSEENSLNKIRNLGRCVKTT